MFARMIVGSLVSAVLLFLWGYVFWGMNPFAEKVMRTAPNQEAYVESLNNSVTESGVYIIPAGADRMDDESVAPLHEAGPIATLFFHKEGAPMMSPKVMGYGFLHMLLSAFIAAIVVAASEARTFFSRFMLVFWVSIFAAVWVELSNVVWYYFPMDYFWLKFAYHVSAGIIMAIVLGLIIQPLPQPGTEEG